MKRQVVVTTSQCEYEWTHYCQWPGGPGCKDLQISGTPERPEFICCQAGDWRPLSAPQILEQKVVE